MSAPVIRHGWKCPTCERVWAPWYPGPCACHRKPAPSASGPPNPRRGYSLADARRDTLRPGASP